jgi:acyl-CoA synthetase (AMP-forming)/AMP-acid ligase II
MRGFVRADDRLKKNGLPDLRTAFSIAGNLDRATAEEFRDRFDAAIVDYYGATEIGNIAFTDPSQPGTMSSRGGWASEVLIRVLDKDGTPCAPGQAGEICVHTGNLMLGYLGPVDDSVPIRDGWYWTGDLGRVHPDGRIEVIGRRRDIVKTHEGGLVSPVQIEIVLYACDVVREACVFGWNDGDGIERLGASVILTAPQRDADQKAVEIQLKTRVLEKLGPYKVAARIVFCDDFPRVARGKPDKRKMRQEFETATAS